MNEFLIYICIQIVLNRWLELGVLLYQLELLFTLSKIIEWCPLAPLFITFLLFFKGKELLDQNDVEFDFSIGNAFVIFPFL